VAVNAGLLSSACLLHDIARRQPYHEISGAKLLLKEGYPATAQLVARHMDLPEEYVPKPDALGLLYLADKLCRGDKATPIGVTREEAARRFCDDPPALAAAERRMARAQAILEMLETQYGITYEDIAQ
jgi:hypothetical protein